MNSKGYQPECTTNEKLPYIYIYIFAIYIYIYICRLVHETRMNRMRAKYKRIHKMFKYSNIHAYFIGFAYVFAISCAYSSAIMVSTKVGARPKAARPPLWRWPEATPIMVDE